MTYHDLIQLYFDRSNALQWYWTIYVIIVGGLLAFSSLRQRPDLATAILVSVLYLIFAYKNLGAIEDVTKERLAIWMRIGEYAIPDDAVDVKGLRERLEPFLVPSAWEDSRNTHIAGDILTIAACWAMEWRRRRWQPPPGTPAA